MVMQFHVLSQLQTALRNAIAGNFTLCHRNRFRCTTQSQAISRFITATDVTATQSLVISHFVTAIDCTAQHNLRQFHILSLQQTALCHAISGNFMFCLCNRLHFTTQSLVISHFVTAIDCTAQRNLRQINVLSPQPTALRHIISGNITFCH